MIDNDKRTKTVSLGEHVRDSAKNYLQSQELKNNGNLYQIILEEIEIPLFRATMEHARYNQSRAARLLGISRGTLRTKLKQYFDDEFIGSNEE